MMKKSKAVISMIVTVALIALLGFTTIVGFGKGGTGAARNIKLGLDLAGGVSITYQVKDKNPSVEDMNDTIYKLQQRVEQYSTEASVYQEGDDRISIEIPGVTDANAILEDLGSPGELYFVSQKGSDGTDNYTYDSASEKFVMAEGKTIDSLQADGCVVLTGTDVKSAQATQTQDEMKNKKNVVTLSFTEDGTNKFADATTTASAAGQSIGIYYDGEFVSAPNVNEPILDGSAEISGGDMDEDFANAQNLASYIRIGGLSLQLEELRSNVVAAQLGEDAIRTSLLAGIIGLIIVFIFMCIVYRVPGFASGLGLIIYTTIVLVILNAFDLTLTLPGIAGIILGIGMAVDANVIIFARVKEEIAAGKSVQVSLKSGFHKALSAILDGNITTLIAAAVLAWKGSGSVKGFAYTLAISIIVSMFTALVIVRMISYAFYTLGIKDVKFYGMKKEGKQINFLQKKKLWFSISAVVILVGLVAIGVNAGRGTGAFNYALEFKGGTSSTVSFAKDYSIKEIDSEIIPEVEKITGDANVQAQKVASDENENQIVIKTRTLELSEREALEKALDEKFGLDKKTETPVTSENISATVSSEMRTDAAVAVVLATLCMLIYIFIRFKDFRFAASAIIALIHDVLVVVTFYAISRTTVGNTFIACMLTIVGYSINATIVIFDRIREEYKTKSHSMSLQDVVNRSINLTLTRSIYTSFTTFVMVAVLYVLGVTSIKEFAMPLIVGIVAGAYSSIFITGALWYLMKTRVGKRRIAE